MIPMAPRFVIQKHAAATGDHYDLMLEAGQALATWRIDRPPPDLAAGESMPATALGDHRPAYLTYEGEVSGGRGTVAIADAGEYRTLARTHDAWRFLLKGRKAQTAFELTRLSGDEWELRRAEV